MLRVISYNADMNLKNQEKELFNYLIWYYFLSLKMLTNALKVPTHVMQMQTVPIPMVHFIAIANLVFLVMGKHVQVYTKIENRRF